MIIIGCDYHPGFQEIAFVDTETGDCREQQLKHGEGAQEFYRALVAQGKKVRVRMEASGHARWFERLLAELNIELWRGDATNVGNAVVANGREIRVAASLSRQWEIFLPSFERHERNEHD